MQVCRVPRAHMQCACPRGDTHAPVRPQDGLPAAQPLQKSFLNSSIIQSFQLNKGLKAKMLLFIFSLSSLRRGWNRELLPQPGGASQGRSFLAWQLLPTRSGVWGQRPGGHCSCTGTRRRRAAGRWLPGQPYCSLLTCPPNKHVCKGLSQQGQDAPVPAERFSGRFREAEDFFSPMGSEPIPASVSLG